MGKERGFAPLDFSKIKNLSEANFDLEHAFIGNIPDFSKCIDIISDFNINAKFIGNLPAFHDSIDLNNLT